jgi:branched-chain amino acid transport system permease protein
MKAKMDACFQKWTHAVVYMKPRPKAMVLLALLAVLVMLPMVITQNYIIHIVINCFIYITLSLSLNLIIGWSGQFSLGHVAFYGMGAYFTALLMLKSGMNFWLATLISAVAVGCISWILCRPTLKLRGDYLAVVTLGMGEVFRLICNNWTSVTRGSRGLPNIPHPELFGFVFRNKMSFYYLGLVMFLLALIFISRLNTSGFGMALRTIKEDDVAAASIGIYPVKYKLNSFVIGCVIASVVGSFYAVYLGFISPSSFEFSESMSMMAMVVLGGMGSIPGVIIGSTVLTALPEMLRSLSDYRLVFYGALMVVMMVFRPGGIWGSKKRLLNIYKVKVMRGKVKVKVHE